jgi:predicted transcriptional regulator
VDPIRPEKRGRKILLSTSQIDSTELSRGSFLDTRNQKEVSGATLAMWGVLKYRLDLAGYGILLVRYRRAKMPEGPPSALLDRELTSTIVAAYVRCNQIGADHLGALISTVHQALAGLGKPVAEVSGEREPAVPIRRSFHRDFVICLECGWRGQMLKRHLATGHGLSVDQYRARWNLPREHPITAPGYSERRSGLAKQIGLGRGRRSSREEPEPVEPEIPAAPQPRSRRRGRPRSAET